MSCWLTAYVLSNQQVRAQVQEELQAAVKTSSASSDEPLSSRIAQIPLETWENSLPVLDNCIRETLRINITQVANRKNVGDKDIVIETGDHGESK